MNDLNKADLPEILARYFESTDRQTALSTFAPDARVHDEGEWHEGSAAIADWLASVEKRYRPRYRIESMKTEGDRIIIGFEVSGTFPGSPARLRQAFTLNADNRIASLQTL